MILKLLLSDPPQFLDPSLRMKFGVGMVVRGIWLRWTKVKSTPCRLKLGDVGWEREKENRWRGQSFRKNISFQSRPTIVIV